MIGTAVLLGVAALLALYMVVVELRDRRPPPELRGDWWPRFEMQFRAYARAQRSRSERGGRP